MTVVVRNLPHQGHDRAWAGQVRTLGTVALADVPVLLALSLVIRPAWARAVFVLAGLSLVAYVYLRVTAILRVPHRLTSDVFEVRLGGRFRCRVPLSQVERSDVTEALPVHIGPRGYLSFDPETGVLTAVTARDPVVRLRLAAPLTVAHIPGQGTVEVRGLMVNVDEPELLVGELSGSGASRQVAGQTLVKSNPVDSWGELTPATSGVTLEADVLVKRYGRLVAVDGLSLRIRPGELVGLVGPNGAGKSTTLRMLAGLLAPDAGAVVYKETIPGGTMHDRPAGSLEAKALLGYAPDTPQLYGRLTGLEFLLFMAGLYGLDPAAGADRSRRLLEGFGLARHQDRLVAGYSLGMKRKLSLAAALIHRPSLLLLDEVTSGLDPLSVRQFKLLLTQLKAEGCGILLATHVLSLAQEVCDSVAILAGGRIVATGTLPQLREVAGSDGDLEDIFVRLMGQGGWGTG